jgi:uncharacterized protein (DUF2267 family)
MEDIVKIVAEKADVSEEVARQAVDTVIEVLKEKLPDPLAGQLEDVLSGDASLDDLAKGIGGMLGLG